jgi:hypothetical protein
MGALTSEQNEMFLRNPRFLGLKFPDMTRPETLEKRYSGIMAKKELSFMKVQPPPPTPHVFLPRANTVPQGLLRMDPAERLTGSSALEHPCVALKRSVPSNKTLTPAWQRRYFEGLRESDKSHHALTTRSSSDADTAAAAAGEHPALRAMCACLMQQLQAA